LRIKKNFFILINNILKIIIKHMGKANPRSRQLDIQVKQKRQEKLKKLQERYVQVSKKQEKEEIVRKVQKLAPYLDAEEYLKK